MNICNDSILDQNCSAVEQKSMKSIESVSFENVTVNFKQRTPLASISPNRETERSINLHHDHNYCNLGNPVISNLPKYVQLAIKKVCGPKEATRGSVQTTSSTFNVCDTFSSCRQSLSRNQSLQSLHPLPENHKHFKVSIELDGRKWSFFMSGYGAQIAEALARAQEGSSEELGKAIIESYILKQLPKQKPPHKELNKTSTPEKQSVNKENTEIYTLDEASLPNEQVLHEEITEADPLDEAFLPNEQSLHENTTETDPLDEACLSNEKLHHDATINTHPLDKEFLSNEPLLHDDATEIHPLNEAPLSNEQLLHDKTMEFTNKETTQTHLLHETYISNDPLQNEATETCPSGETCLPNEESLDEDTTEKYSLVKQFLNFKTVEKSTKTEDPPLQKMSWKIASVILPSKKTFDSGSGIENSETIVRQQPSSTFQTLLGNKTSSKRPIVNMTAKSSATNRSNSAATRPNDDFQRRPIIYPRKCGVCEHTYVSRQTFSKHKKSCMPALEMSNLICPSCGKKFGFRSRFKFHVNHCGFGSCRNCRKGFKSHIRFDNHKKMFEKMKKCKDCNGLYVNECSFSRHQVLCKKYRRVLEYPETLHFDSILKFEEWMNDENGKLSRKDRYFVKVSGTQLTSNNKKFYRFRCKFEKERKRQCKNGIPTRVRILTPNYQCRARIHVTEYSDGRVVAKYNPNHSHPCGDIQIYSRSIYPRVCSLCLNTYKSKHLFYHHKKTCLPFLEMKKNLTGSAVSHLEAEVVQPMTDHSILGI